VRRLIIDIDDVTNQDFNITDAEFTELKTLIRRTLTERGYSARVCSDAPDFSMELECIENGTLTVEDVQANVAAVCLDAGVPVPDHVMEVFR